jgi:hypothetical protein
MLPYFFEPFILCIAKRFEKNKSPDFERQQGKTPAISGANSSIGYVTMELFLKEGVFVRQYMYDWGRGLEGKVKRFIHV